MLAGVLIGVLAMSSRSGRVNSIGFRDIYCVVGDLHTFRDIAKVGEPANMSTLVALDRIQASPQSFCLNDAAL